MNDATSIIEADGISKEVLVSGQPLQILNGIDLLILRGDSVAVVGVSGSGKSTLLGLLAGLDLPSSGTIKIAGKTITDMDEDERASVRARHVGFVFQSFQLLPNLTALENVMLPLEILNVENISERANTILTRVGLQERIQHYPRQLSGGEQQRVALARAFVTEPDVLFADEPTGNLDSKTGAQIIELLFELNQEKQTTLVLVTHDQQLAQRCQHSITLDAGTIDYGEPGS